VVFPPETKLSLFSHPYLFPFVSFTDHHKTISWRLAWHGQGPAAGAAAATGEGVRRWGWSLIYVDCLWFFLWIEIGWNLCIFASVCVVYRFKLVMFILVVKLNDLMLLWWLVCDERWDRIELVVWRLCHCRKWLHLTDWSVYMCLHVSFWFDDRLHVRASPSCSLLPIYLTQVLLRP
jgi:hypothetical protein